MASMITVKDIKEIIDVVPPRPGDNPDGPKPDFDPDDKPERSDEKGDGDPDDDDLLKDDDGEDGGEDGGGDGGTTMSDEARRAAIEAAKAAMDQEIEDMDTDDDLVDPDSIDEGISRNSNSITNSAKLDIPQELIDEVNKLAGQAKVIKRDWYSTIKGMIKEASGSKEAFDENVPSHRMPGQMGSEEDISEFRSVLVIFDVSGSMRYKSSVKSLKIISDVFEDHPAFRKLTIWVAHYGETLTYEKLGRFSRSRFLAVCQKGFNRSDGDTAYYQLLTPFVKQIVRPKVDFTLHFTDGKIWKAPADSADPIVRKWMEKTITIIVQSSSTTGTRLYAIVKKYAPKAAEFFLLGAKAVK